MFSPATRLTRAKRDVLRILITSEEAHDALRIAHDARRRAATVYPILADLEASGWVRSDWSCARDDPRESKRRLYRLTGRGTVAASRLLPQQDPEREPALRRPALRPVANLPSVLPRLLWGTR
jgi:DNA-binding PadR family transcriptional regulator